MNVSHEVAESMKEIHENVIARVHTQSVLLDAERSSTDVSQSTAKKSVGEIVQLQEELADMLMTPYNEFKVDHTKHAHTHARFAVLKQWLICRLQESDDFVEFAKSRKISKKKDGARKLVIQPGKESTSDVFYAYLKNNCNQLLIYLLDEIFGKEAATKKQQGKSIKAVCTRDFKADHPGVLSLQAGDEVTIIDKEGVKQGWWLVQFKKTQGSALQHTHVQLCCIGRGFI